MAAHLQDRARVLASYYEGVSVIRDLAGDFSDLDWTRQTPCSDWDASDLAGHLRCMADNHLDWLEEGPNNRFARLIAWSATPEEMTERRARQNAAELAVLPDDCGRAHIDEFVKSAVRHAELAEQVWERPCYSYGDWECCVGDQVGVACVEWHLHASDLARTIGTHHRPSDPELLELAWRAGIPYFPIGSGEHWAAVVVASGRQLEQA